MLLVCTPAGISSTKGYACILHPNQQLNKVAWHVAGCNLFALAAKTGLADVVQFVGERAGLAQHAVKESVNAPDVNGRTALHHAVVRSANAMVELLLDFGASVRAADCHGNRPLHLATSTQIAETLVNAGADVCALNNLQQTAAARLEVLGLAPVLVRYLTRQRVPGVLGTGLSPRQFAALVALALIVAAFVAFYVAVLDHSLSIPWVVRPS